MSLSTAPNPNTPQSARSRARTAKRLLTPTVPAPPVPPPPVPIMASPAPTAEVWKSDPLQGDFNPGSKIGKDIFLEKTKGLPEDKQYDLTNDNAAKIHAYI